MRNATNTNVYFRGALFKYKNEIKPRDFLLLHHIECLPLEKGRRMKILRRFLWDGEGKKKKNNKIRMPCKPKEHPSLTVNDFAIGMRVENQRNPTDNTRNRNVANSCYKNVAV